MSTSASVSGRNFSWYEISKHAALSAALSVTVYMSIHRMCKRSFSKSHPLCDDERKSPPKEGVARQQGKGTSMSSKLATRVISTINALCCCAIGVFVMLDVFHNDGSDYFSGCGNGIDIFLCWAGGCVIGYLVADWVCEGVEDVTMAVHHIVGAVMIFSGCQPYIAGVVSHVYLMELSTIPLNVSWYKLKFTQGKFESTATPSDKRDSHIWNKAFQLSFLFVRCIWCPMNFVRAVQAFLRCHTNVASISLSDIPSLLPVVSLFLVVIVQFLWLYKIAIAPMLKGKSKRTSPSQSSSKTVKS